MMVLEDYLKRNAEEYTEKIAVTCGDRQLSYGQLLQAVKERVAEKQTNALPAPSKIVPFRASQSIDCLVDYFAIHWAGDVAMPMEKDVPEELFLQCQALAAASSTPEGTADVLLTTGTTGKSKGVIISHKAIVANAENLIEAQGYHHDLTFLICGPLNHIGSLSKIYPILLVGGSLVILEGMKDIDLFFRCIEAAEGKVATFLVPSSISMLLAFAEKKLTEVNEKMEFIETGAAPISQTCMQRLCQVLPHTRLYNTYASTETGIISTYNYNQGECLAGCLGSPMRHSSLEISEDGKVVCGGDTLMSGYLNDDALTASVLWNGKIHTNDIGTIDGQGRLWLQGRNDDIINVGGFKVNPTDVENVAMAFPGIADCICVAFEHPVIGPSLKLLYVLKAESDFSIRPFVHFLKGKLESYKVPQKYEMVDHVQRTFNGKPDRKFYR